ncbi:MAG: GNAT family protein [Bacteroidia bacterium]
MTFDNFIIRQLDFNDAAAFFQLLENNRHRISTYFPRLSGNTNTLGETRTYITDRIGADEGKYIIYLVEEKGTKNLAGVILLKDIDTIAMKRELGYFVDANFKNRGVATKSVFIVSKFCFDSLNLNKVFLRIAEENIASQKVAEKCGFKREGILRNDFMTLDGKLINTIYYGLLRDELR